MKALPQDNAQLRRDAIEEPPRKGLLTLPKHFAKSKRWFPSPLQRWDYARTLLSRFLKVIRTIR